ncbi:MAG: MFS transporter [Anaerolineae bacterium]
MATIVQSSAAPAGTLSALRYPNFRLYFFGQLVSVSGSWMQIVAQGWLVFYLTKDELWLGLVACAAGLPSLLLSPIAGVLVDRLPRRNVLIFTQAAQMVLALILSWLTFTNTVQVWHIMVLAFLLGVVNAIDAPARQAIIADLVGTDQLSSGIAMNSIIFNLSRVFGPAAAGIVLNRFGPALCFFVNGISFLAVIGTLFVIHLNNVQRTTGELEPLRRLKEGLQFARRSPTIWPLLWLAVVAAFFTSNLTTLLPAFADTVLHSPKEAYSAITTAIGLGAVVAGLALAPLGRRFGHGNVVIGMVFFVMISAFLTSRTNVPGLAIFLGSLYGFAIILQFVTVNTLIQRHVPDAFRGRVMSLYTLTWFGIAPFGALLMGAIAAQVGAADAIMIAALLGGVVSIGILLRSPQLRQLA